METQKITIDIQKNESRESFQKRLESLSVEQQMSVDMAYDLAKESHRPQVRDTGERYFEHLRDVALILIDECNIKDSDLIIAALLHDSIEDSATFGNRTLPYSQWKETAQFRLSKVFNERVARMVMSLTKLQVDGAEITTKEQAEEIYFQNIREGGEESILLKMCDRLHNLRSLAGTTPEKQQRILKETEEKYYPLFESTSELPLFKEERVLLLGKIKEQVNLLKKNN